MITPDFFYTSSSILGGIAGGELQAQAKAPLSGKAATQSTALYLLAKTYLTGGWSSAAEVADFQKAYDVANSLITDKAKYGADLWQAFASAQINANYYGKGIYFAIDHSADLKFDEYSTGSSASGNKENKTNFFFRPNYPVVSFAGITPAEHQLLIEILPTEDVLFVSCQTSPTQWMLLLQIRKTIRDMIKHFKPFGLQTKMPLPLMEL